MTDVRERSLVDESLHLALDLCLALGAFIAGITGRVRSVVSAAMPPDDGARRIELLASSCLTHPAAHGHDLFWNAEVSTDAELADGSLACVVMPMWMEDTLVGLLGVVDTWLPEPDEEQSDGLRSLADSLAVSLPQVLVERQAGGEAQVVGQHGAHVVGGGDVMSEAARSLLLPSGAPELAEAADVTEVVDDPIAWRSIFQVLPGAVVVTRRDGTVEAANDAFVALCGRHPADLVGSDLGSFMTGCARGTGGPAKAGAAALGSCRVLATAGGDEVVVTMSERRVSDGLGGEWVVIEARPTPMDPTAAAAARVDVAQLIGQLDDGLLCLDATGIVVLANAAADAMHGMPPGQTLVGAPLPVTTAMRTEDGKVLARDDHPGLRTLRDGAPCIASLTIGEEGDAQRHVEMSAHPVLNDGFDGVLVVLHDTTEQWLGMRRLAHRALYDPLTGLANHDLFLEEVDRMLHGLGRRDGTVVVVCLDLDDLGPINDKCGHDIGDEVLGAVARRLRASVRGDDVVSRLGGDSFVVAHLSDKLPDGDLVVSRLRKVMSAPFRVRDHVLDVGASVGWASTDRGDLGPDALLAKAVHAMQRHKPDRTSLVRSWP